MKINKKLFVVSLAFILVLAVALSVTLISEAKQVSAFFGCSDSDGNLGSQQFFTAGKVAYTIPDGSYVYYDTCNGNILEEGTCLNGHLNLAPLNCALISIGMTCVTGQIPGDETRSIAGYCGYTAG